MIKTITAIHPAKRDPNLRDVYVDDSLTTTLHLSLVESLHIEINQEWTEEIEDRVSKLQESTKARQIAIDLISRRLWGTAELKMRLIKRGISKPIALETVNQLIEDDWLDDLNYAKALIKEWLRKEPAGRKWLLHKLLEKKISSEVSGNAVNDELGDISEQELATNLAIIRISKLTSTDDSSLRRKVMSVLARKGFSMDVASEAFRHAQENHA